MNILHIDCSPRPESFSRKLSAGIVEKLLTEVPGASICRRDLGSDPLPHISAEYATGVSSPSTLMSAPLTAWTLSEEVIREVEAADIIVIGSPVNNFAVPSVLKAWIDQLLRMGRTIMPTPEGAKVGTLRDRPVLIGVASGGVFTGEGAKQPDFFTPYLKAVFGCVGITNLRFFLIQATAFLDPDQIAAATHLTLATINLPSLGTKQWQNGTPTGTLRG